MIRTTSSWSLFILATGAAVILGSGISAISQTFTSTSTLTAPRIFHTATLLNDGQVLITGGSDAGATAELFDPAIAEFSPVGSMGTTRTLHTATLLNDGQVLIAGGVGSDTSVELFDPATETFTTTGNMTTARSNHTATLLPNGHVLLAGGTGSDGGSLATAERYDPLTGTFTPTSNLTSARMFHRATLLTNGQVLLTGGAEGTATAELYDPATGTFTPASTMTVARSNHTSTLLSTGQVLIVGGAGDGLTLSSAELFDPATGVFTPTGDLLTERRNPTATLLSNGQVLVAGGLAGGSTAELFDPATGVFSPTEPLTTERAFQTATRMPTGQVLIAGGVGGSTTAELFEIPIPVTPEVTPEVTPPGLFPLEGRFLAVNSMITARQSHTATLLSSGQVLIAGGFGGGATAELFDTEAESFFPTGNMIASRHEHTAVSLTDGRVLVAGGSGGGATAELFDLDTESFTETDNLTATRSRHTATLLTDGRVLLTGGISENGQTLATAEVFDPTTESFTTTDNLTTARSRHTATLLADGRVLLTGGLGDIFALATAEVFDPTTESFTAVSNLTTARSLHTATLLPDGNVLIAGGIAQEATAGKTAELFDPTTESFLAIGPMTATRELHTATVLPSGHVLLAGGAGAFAETFDPENTSFAAITSMTTPRQLHTATLLQNGQLLLTGGVGILSTAELFVKSAPDLAMIVTKLTVKAKEGGNRLKVKVTINNLGTEAANGPFNPTGAGLASIPVSLYLSADETLDELDTPLQTISINDLNAGAEAKIKFKVKGLGSITDMFALVTIDPVAGEENTHNNTLTRVIDAAATVAAGSSSFPLVTVTRAGDGSGMITSAPEGITCVSTDITATGCASNFPANATVLFTATADPGSVFTGWSGDACNVTLIVDDSLSGTCQFVSLLQNRSIIASFELASTTPTPAAPTPAAPTPAAPTPAAPTPGQEVTLSVIVSGQGAIETIPGGIMCGTGTGGDCTEVFSSGSVVILQATPAPGWALAGWSGGGCAGSGLCTVPMTQSHTVSAEFSSSVTLTVTKPGLGSGEVKSAPAGIDCGLDCTETYPIGTPITLQAFPSSTDTFIGWSGGGCTGNGQCVVIMTQNFTVGAEFSGPVGSSAALTVTKIGTGTGTVTSSPAGILCGADCTNNYTTGTSVSLTAIPATTADETATFAGWSGGVCGGTSTCTVPMTQARTVTAEFTNVSSAASLLTVIEVKETGTGSITATGISCGSNGSLTDCSESIVTGTAITLEAAPASGSTFIGWGGGGCSGTATTCTVTMTHSKTVIAAFDAASTVTVGGETFTEQTLAVGRTGSGVGTVTSMTLTGTTPVINCGSDCSHAYSSGAVATLTATEETGSTFAGWSGGCSGTNISCNIELTAPVVVIATFN